MTVIEWKSEFFVGIPKMDADHRNMIELINRLYGQLQSGQRQTTIIAILEELYASAAKHFAHEEAIMREWGCDDYAGHEADHQRFLHRVTTWMSDYQTERLDDGIAKWLANWFCNHFQRRDARLHLPNNTSVDSVRPLTITLHRIPIFASLTEKDLEDLASHLDEVKYRKGSAIISADDPDTKFFVVAKGKVKVVVYSADGREVILSWMKDGDFFGDMGLLDGEPRSANVIAQGDVSLLTLERDDFISWLEGHPSAFMMFTTELSRRLKDANERIRSLVVLDVYGRVAHRILELARDEGKRVRGGILIAERPTQAELAGFVGASRESVARAMSELQRRGYIRKRGRGFLLSGGKGLEAEVMG